MAKNLLTLKTKHHPDLGLLALRVGLGLVFLVNGWMKLGDMDMTVEKFAGFGLSALFAWLVAIVEFAGGIAVIVGLWTEVASWLLAVVMLVAIVLVKGELGFTAFQLDLALLLLAVGVALLGPGKYSIVNTLKK